MRDLVIWEPGETVICALCEHERGGDVPPGPWTRDYSTHRRRIPIFRTSPLETLGWMEYVWP